MTAPEPPLDVDTFLAGLDSPNHNDESRRAWVALFYRDMKLSYDAARVAAPSDGLREGVRAKLQAALDELNKRGGYAWLEARDAITFALTTTGQPE